MADLLADFARAAARHPDRIALVEPGGRAVTFAALAARARALAGAWGRLAPGEPVLIALPLGADLYAALAALWMRGAAAVLPEPATGLPGLRAALRAVPVRAMCTAGPYRLLRALPALWRVPRLPLGAGGDAGLRAPAPEDVALISFTSGTTGTPKAIARSHAFLAAQREALGPLLASDAPETDLVAFPVFVLLNLAEGRTSVLPDWPLSRTDRAGPERIRARAMRHGATRLLLPPSLLEGMPAASLPPAVRAIFTGGGPVFPDLAERLRAGGRRVVAVYGSTEAEPIAALDAADVSDEDRAAMAAGAGLLAGHPAAGTRVRIVDGEILVAGAHVVQGYLNPSRDASTKLRDGGTIWHRTGDAGRLDGRGRLWLLGRAGAAVPGPEGPIHPFAVETAARHWPGLRRAALAPGPVLAVEGDAGHLAAWRAEARAFGIADVRHVAALPMDRRHRSKIDAVRLMRLLSPKGRP